MLQNHLHAVSRDVHATGRAALAQRGLRVTEPLACRWQEILKHLGVEFDDVPNGEHRDRATAPPTSRWRPVAGKWRSRRGCGLASGSSPNTRPSTGTSPRRSWPRSRNNGGTDPRYGGPDRVRALGCALSVARYPRSEVPVRLSRRLSSRMRRLPTLTRCPRASSDPRQVVDSNAHEYHHNQGHDTTRHARSVASSCWNGHEIPEQEQARDHLEDRQDECNNLAAGHFQPMNSRSTSCAFRRPEASASAR